MTAREPVALLAGVLLLLAGCNPAGDSAAGGKDDEDAKPAIPVEVASAVRGDIYSTYSGTAPIEAFAEATVVAKVGGEVRQILAEEGDDVRSGQVLAKLDGDRLRLELQQSEANLQKLRRDFQRNRDLKEKSLISAGDFDKIQYEMEALEASYDLAKLELSYTEIRAPIDGVISERFVKIGNNVTLWSGNHVGHHSTIEDHVFVASHVVISGGVTVGEGSFLGVNVTLRDHITIGKGNVLAAGALIVKDTPDDSLYVGAPAERSKVPASRLPRSLRHGSLRS